ncbi:MAG: prepilin peptidase [Pseudomonadota bacterium]|nr:prepilin peptidase [Pseudomonadota bacterium]
MVVSLSLDMLLMLMVVLAASNDLLTRRIPNFLLLAGSLGALALHCFAAAPAAALMGAFAGAATGLLVFLPLYCLRGMAAGDVKLMAAAGFFSSPMEMLQLALLTVCAGGVMALVMVIVRGRLRAALANVRHLLRPLWMGLAGMPLAATPLPAASVGTIPYGLAIAIGTLVLLAQRHSG